jgi:predicted KAP-like P-loop ATPase
MTERNTSREKKAEWFSADRPIVSRSEDRLGRRGFAEAIAGAIDGWRGQESLVIALYGPWGTGKSSVKNMVVDALKANGTQLAIIEFNPWEFANRDQLSDSFFDQVAVGLGKGGGKKRKIAVNRWRRYSAYLKTSARLIGLLAKPTALILAIAGVAELGVSLFQLPHLYSTLNGILLLTAAALLWSSHIAEQVVSFLEVGFQAGRKGLEEVKDDLASTLRNLDNPLLVVMDDIDRLTPSELQHTFQLVKANADFPNLVYLILFDREVVIKSIETVLKINGSDYLEKIIQVGFDMPAIEDNRTQSVLSNGLDQVLENIPSEKFNKVRWGNLFVGALKPYFTNLRKINRFLSTLSFHFALFRSQDSFEVNPVDLIGVETLRVFEPGVYQALAHNKAAFTDLPDRSLLPQDEEYRAAVKTVLERASEETRDHAKELLKQLFPPAERALGGSRYGSDFADEWYRQQRVCSSQFFDRYFSFAIPEGDLSQAQIDRILAKTNNRDELCSELRGLADQGLLDVAMQRLEAYKQQISLDRAVPFITGLFDIGEMLSEQSGGMFDISPSMHASRIIYWYLKTSDSQENRREALRICVTDTVGLSLPAHFVSIQEQALTEGRTGEPLLLDAPIVEELKGILRAKIELAAANGDLNKNPHLLMILFQWRNWGGQEQATAFCRELISSQDGALRLLNIFLVRSVSHSMGDYVGRERWYIQLASIEFFLPWEDVDKSLTGLDETVLSPQYRRGVDAFREAVKRRREGKKDLGSPTDDL